MDEVHLFICFDKDSFSSILVTTFKGIKLNDDGTLKTLVENYAQKNRNWNQLWFFWPRWSTVVKQLHIFLFILWLQSDKFAVCNMLFERYFKAFLIVYYMLPTPKIYVVKQTNNYNR